MVRNKKNPLDLRSLRPALELEGPPRGLYAGLSSGFINPKALRKHNVEHLKNDSAATQKHRKKLPSGRAKKDSAEVEKMSEHVNEAVDREKIFTRKRQKDAAKILKENEDIVAALYREESSASKENKDAAVNNKTAEHVNIDFDRKMTLRSKGKDGSPLVTEKGVSRLEKKAGFTVTGAMISTNLKIDDEEFVSGEGNTTAKERKDGSVHPRLIITFKLKMNDDSALPPERIATAKEKEDGFLVPPDTITRDRKRDELAGATEGMPAFKGGKGGAFAAGAKNVNNTQLNYGITGTRKSTRNRSVMSSASTATIDQSNPVNSSITPVIISPQLVPVIAPSHVVARRFVCTTSPNCHNRYVTEWALIRHVRDEHSGLPRPVCPHCQREFKTEETRTRHLEGNICGYMRR